MVDGRDLTGIEALRLAIRRDRGEFAPNRPVLLCGDPDSVHCEHRFERVRGWWHKPKADRWRCVGCGFLTRHYDSIDSVAGRPVHKHMSVAVVGFNTVVRARPGARDDRGEQLWTG